MREQNMREQNSWDETKSLLVAFTYESDEQLKNLFCTHIF